LGGRKRGKRSKGLRILERVSRGIQRGFVFFLLVFSVLAFYFPRPFVPLRPAIIPLLGVIMLGMGMTLTPADFADLLKRPREVILGVATQYLIMPGLGYLLAVVFHLPPGLAAGLVLVGCAPGGTASNVMTYLAGGDVALSVSITATTTLVAPLMTPALTYLLAKAWVPVPVAGLLLDTIKIVVVPVIAGLLLRIFLKERLDRFLALFPLISICAIIAIVAAIVAINAPGIAALASTILLAVLLHNVLGFVLAYGTARLMGAGERSARAIMFETGMQNAGLAAALSLKFFSASAAIPGVVFSICQNLSAPLIVSYWNRKPPPPSPNMAGK
jgi:BASS family bile acid:Na+ symporter